MNTKEYIEKVSKAKEIQRLCKYKKGDWFIWQINDNYSELIVLATDLGYYKKTKTKWLPTLEQLFGMLEQGTGFANLWFFQDWMCDNYNAIVRVNDDLKTKILDCVMETQYNKQWNPDKKVWININAK